MIPPNGRLRSFCFWLPRLSGLAATQQILKADRNARVLILSVHEGRSFVEDAFRAGAIGYVVKSGSVQELLEAIDAVRQGLGSATPRVVRMNAADDVRDRFSRYGVVAHERGDDFGAGIS